MKKPIPRGRVSPFASIIYAYLGMRSLQVKIYNYIRVNFDVGCKINIGSSMGKILELISGSIFPIVLPYIA